MLSLIAIYVKYVLWTVYNDGIVIIIILNIEVF